MMKPTPTKVVLLMSAAGLGLSWSGVALASRDNNAPTSLAWTFGTPPRSEQDCNPRALDGLASCPLSGGEILQTTVAEASALPLPLAPMHPSSDAKTSFRAFDAYEARSTTRPYEVRTGGGEPEPIHEAPRPEVAVPTRVAGGSSRDPEADAIAMVLLDSLQDVADATATVAELADHRPAAERQRTVVQSVPREPDTTVRERVVTGIRSGNQALDADTTAAPGGELPEGSLDSHTRRAGAEVTIDDPVRVRSSSAHEVKTTAAVQDEPAGSPFVIVVQADDRSAKAAQVPTSEDPTRPDTASIERVFASLADVLGSQLEDSPATFDVSPQRTAAPEMDVVRRAAAAVAAVDPVPLVSASAVDPTRNDRSALNRSAEAEDIVVATSHSDKILLSLAALRSGEASELGLSGARTKKTIVVRHSDKVLETLALFRSKTPKREAFACTQTPEDRARIGTPSRATWEPAEQASASTTTAFTPEVDILLDLSPHLAERSAEPVLHAVPAGPTPSEPPVAVRTDQRAFGNEMVAVSSDKLDEIRGGFVTDTGLKISFGIERAVYIDGNLVTTTSLNIADLSKIAGGQAQVTGTSPGSLALVQSGAGNTFAPGSISSTAAGTVIQNTLDNKQINTVTRIDAVVNSVGIMRSINLQSSMRSAIIDSLRR